MGVLKLRFRCPRCNNKTKISSILRRAYRLAKRSGQTEQSKNRAEQKKSIEGSKIKQSKKEQKEKKGPSKKMSGAK